MAAEVARLPGTTIGMVAVLAVISLSPRFPVPIGIASRRFDLRIEDMVLAGLLLSWAVRGPRLRPGTADRPMLIALGL
jgi:hypothetical protein